MPGFEYFGESERNSVKEVLDSGILMRYGFDGLRNGIWKAREFEAAFSARMGVKHTHLVSSGTAALTTALAAAGIGSGDQVIVPVFTFVASFEAVLSVGAVPVLCNIDDTLGLDPKDVEALITDKTRAIMAVHMCGSMADLGLLQKIANTHNLVLIEDACQAIGGSYNGKPLGSIGHIGCFSFDFVKTITCGEGGAIVTNNTEYFEKGTAFSDHGHDHLGMDRGADEHPYLGYNYRISELHAAVGVAQLKRLDEFLAIQKKHYDLLYKALSMHPGIEFRRVPSGGVENYSFLNFFLPNSVSMDSIVQYLRDQHFDGVFYWYSNNWHYHRKWEHLKELKSLHSYSKEVLKAARINSATSFTASDSLMERNLSIIIKLSWSSDELERRCAILRNLGQML